MIAEKPRDLKGCPEPECGNGCRAHGSHLDLWGACGENRSLVMSAAWLQRGICSASRVITASAVGTATE